MERKKDVKGGHCLIAWPKVTGPPELGGFPSGGTAQGDGRIPRHVGRVRRCPGIGEVLSFYGPGACEKCGEYRVGLLQIERQVARQPCWPRQPEMKILI